MADEAKNNLIDSSSIEKQTSSSATIDPLSGRSLYLILGKNNQQMAQATGFIARKKNEYYLITNWHVLSGRHPQTNEIIDLQGQVPDSVWIWHHKKNLGNWILKEEKLYDISGKKRWKEHAEGRKIDIVALKLENLTEDVEIHPFDLNLANADMIPEVAMPISIIGFPLGFSGSGKFPIWKTGHIASEPELNYNNEPLFLIDATTRGGMSGSPVVLRLSGDYKMKSGGRMLSSGGRRTLFLGVYSGRLPGDTEIGRVWRPHLINEIIET